MYYMKNNIKLFYEVYGEENSEEILILPGWGNTRKTFADIINQLKNNYKVYIFDYPGFGDSPFPNKDLDIYDYSNLIYSFIKENNIKNPNIISHSFGGRISIILTGLYKVNIDKLILIDIAGIRRKSIKRTFKTIIYKLRKKLVIFKKNKIKYLNNLRKKYSSTDYNNLNKNMYMTFKNIINEDLRKYIKEIKEETLIIWGKQDKDTPVKDGYYINKKIKNSKLIIYENVSHFSYIEEKKVEKEIKLFLKKNYKSENL